MALPYRNDPVTDREILARLFKVFKVREYLTPISFRFTRRDRLHQATMALLPHCSDLTRANTATPNHSFVQERVGGCRQESNAS